MKSIQTAGGEGRQGQHQVRPSVTQGMIVQQQRWEGTGKSQSEHCKTCGRGGGHGMPRIRARRSPCCLPRSGNGLSQQSPKTRGDYLASVHIQKRRGFMAQRDSCWRLQSAEIRACPGERARKSAQEPLWHRCSVSHGPRGPGSRVSVLSCV